MAAYSNERIMSLISIATKKSGLLKIWSKQDLIKRFVQGQDIFPPFLQACTLSTSCIQPEIVAVVTIVAKPT